MRKGWNFRHVMAVEHFYFQIVVQRLKIIPYCIRKQFQRYRSVLLLPKYMVIWPSDSERAGSEIFVEMFQIHCRQKRFSFGNENQTDAQEVFDSGAADP